MTTKVLICDDEAIMRRLVRACLERPAAGEGARQYEINEAEDGDEALELARRVRPDLIFLDVMMPGRSGLDVLRELRGDPELARTRVIVLTGRAASTDRDAAEGVGADRYLPKPFLTNELREAVEELLGRDVD